MSGDATELARAKGANRTIPNKRAELAVLGSANSAFSFAAITPTGGGGAVDLRGKWVFLQARGGDVTVKRGAAVITEAGDGITIVDKAREEFFLDPNDPPECNDWGSAACNLDILWDDKG